MLGIGGELAEREVRGDRRLGARLAVRLEGAHEQPAAVAAGVVVAVEVADVGQLVAAALDRAADDPHVLGGVHGQARPAGAREARRPQAGAQGDRLALDRPVRGPHPVHAPVADEDLLHRDALPEPGAGGGGELGQRERDPARVHGRVLRIVDGAHEAGGIDERLHAPDLLRAQLVRLHAVVVRHRGLVAQLGHPLGHARHGERAAAVEADVEPGLGLEARVDLGRVGRDLGQRVRGPRAREQPGGVPVRPRRQARALEHDDVALAARREVEGHARADDPATDHDHAGAVGWRPPDAGDDVGGPHGVVDDLLAHRSAPCPVSPLRVPSGGARVSRPWV